MKISWKGRYVEQSSMLVQVHITFTDKNFPRIVYKSFIYVLVMRCWEAWARVPADSVICGDGLASHISQNFWSKQGLATWDTSFVYSDLWLSWTPESGQTVVNALSHWIVAVKAEVILMAVLSERARCTQKSAETWALRKHLPLSTINCGDKILSILKNLCYSLIATILVSAQCPTSYQTSGVYCVKLVSPMLFVTIVGCVKISIKLHTNIRKILLEGKARTTFLNTDDISLYWQIQNAPYNPRWQKHRTLWENLQESPKTRQKVFSFLDSAALRYIRTGNIKW